MYELLYIYDKINVNKQKGFLMHEFVTNDWFIFITGLCSVISLFISLFVVNRVIKIDKSLSIKNQNISVTGSDNKTAGGNNA